MFFHSIAFCHILFWFDNDRIFDLFGWIMLRKNFTVDLKIVKNKMYCKSNGPTAKYAKKWQFLNRKWLDLRENRKNRFVARSSRENKIARNSQKLEELTANMTIIKPNFLHYFLAKRKIFQIILIISAILFLFPNCSVHVCFRWMAIVREQQKPQNYSKIRGLLHHQ